MKKLSLFRNLLVITGFLIFIVSCKPSDADITTAVTSKISSISGAIAEVKDGVVTLSGQVADDASKAAAEAALQGVKGVKSVVNNLTVTPAPPPAPVVTINPDDVLRTGLDAAFASKGFKGISSTVVNGEVTLTGNVKKADLSKVMEAANELKPRKVINKMTIVK